MKHPARIFQTIGLGALAITLFGCGGGGGGAGNNGAGVNSDGSSLPLSVVSSCAQDLDALIRSAPASGPLTIPNIANGCDYLVEGRVSISRNITINGDVTFAMSEGAQIEFRGTETLVDGTAANPVRFQALDPAKPWGHIYFSNDNAQVTHTLFANGGATDNGPYSGAPAMVYSGGEGTVLNNNRFIGSTSTGLSLIDASARSEGVDLQRNVFSGNANYGLSVQPQLLSSLDLNSDYLGGALANGKAGILINGGVVNSQVVKSLGVPYTFDIGARDKISFNGSLVEPGVTLRIPDDADVELLNTILNGSESQPLRLSAENPDASGWGALVLTRNSQLRSVVIENGGSQASTAGASLSVDAGRGDLIEKVKIVKSRSWGMICRNASSSISVSGLTFEESALGDIHPNCLLNSLPNVAEGSRRDPSACAELVLASAQYTRPVFDNTDSVCDFYIVGDVIVNSAVTITPGTNFLIARDSSLTINGSLIANGTVEQPIVLQGEYAEDGYWAGLSVSGSTMDLSHIEIEDGGSLDKAAITLLRPDRISLDTQIEASLTAMVVSGSLGDGLVIDNKVDLLSFVNNSFIGNGRFGLVLPITEVSRLGTDSLYDSAMAANGTPGIRLLQTYSAGISLSEGSYTLSNLGSPWSLPATQIIDGTSTGAQLVIGEGVRIMFDQDAVFRVQSYGRNPDEGSRASVTINGTPENPVTLSGPADMPNAWSGIAAAGNLTISNTTIIGGGEVDDAASTASGGALTISGSANTELTSVTIQNSRGWGITCNRSSNATINLSGISYSGNELGSINPECGS